MSKEYLYEITFTLELSKYLCSRTEEAVKEDVQKCAIDMANDIFCTDAYISNLLLSENPLFRYFFS